MTTTSTSTTITIVLNQIDAPDPFDSAGLVAAAHTFATGLDHTAGHEATLVSCSVSLDEIVNVPTLEHVSDIDLPV